MQTARETTTWFTVEAAVRQTPPEILILHFFPVHSSIKAVPGVHKHIGFPYRPVCSPPRGEHVAGVEVVRLLKEGMTHLGFPSLTFAHVANSNRQAVTDINGFKPELTFLLVCILFALLSRLRILLLLKFLLFQYVTSHYKSNIHRDF